MSDFRVVKFIPQGLYGFVGDGSRKAYFHLSDFSPGLGGPPPIVGEVVDVVRLEEGGRTLRARGVVRRVRAEPEVGVVVRFDPNVGYGFLESREGKSFFLHRSEFLRGELPYIGMRVRFYASKDYQSVPRACHPVIEDRG